MKCFYHTETDAVGTCSQCGKAACRECIEDVGGALLCKGCLDLQHQAAEQEAHELEEAKQIDLETAKKKIRTAWIIGALGGGTFGPFMAVVIANDPSSPPDVPPLPLLLPLMTLGFGYGFWSFYWGIPPTWRWWRGLVSRIGCFLIANPLTWIVLIAFFFWFPVILGMYYGMLGGGIYQFRKHTRIAAGTAE